MVGFYWNEAGIRRKALIVVIMTNSGIPYKRKSRQGKILLAYTTMYRAKFYFIRKDPNDPNLTGS